MSVTHPPSFDAHPLNYDDARGRGYLRAICLDVIDGDTVRALLDLGCLSYVYAPLRLAGVDAPEIFRPESEAERARGMEAKAFVGESCEGQPILVRTHKDRTSFGRWIADIEYIDNGQWYNLAARLIADGLAVASP